MSEQHRIDIAIFPFLEDVPSEIAIFRPQHKPVLALEREARSRGRASKLEEVAPRWPKIATIGSRWPLDKKISKRVKLFIVIFSCLIDVSNEIVICKAKLCPPMAPTWPKTDRDIAKSALR